MYSLARTALVLLGLSLPLSTWAQSVRSGEEALRTYYRTLELSLAPYLLDEIPFNPTTVKIKKNDSLVGIARKIGSQDIDSFHLAVAIYQNNQRAFKNNDPSRLKSGALLSMPTVAELNQARDQFERVTINGKKLDLSGHENVMRNGLRLPFDSLTKPKGSISEHTQASPVVTLLPQSTSTAEISTPETMPVPIATVPKVTWNVSLWGKRRAFTEHVEKLSQLVAERTGGEFVLKLHYGGLSKPKENLNGIASGAFEMAQFCAGYHEDKNPSITVLELPFLGVENLEQERYVSQWLYRHPAVLEDFNRWNAVALMPSPLPQYNIAGVGPAPESLNDFSGLSIRATGGIGKAMAAVNAFPTPITASEVKQSLESGFIEAVAFAPHAHMSFNIVDTAQWWTTNLNPGTVNCPVVASANAVRALSPKYLDALYGSINEALDHYIDNYNFNTMSAWSQTLNDEGIRQVTFSDTEISAFQHRISQSAATTWIEKNSSLGLPARELFTLVKVALSGDNPELVTNNGILHASNVKHESTASSSDFQQVAHAVDSKSVDTPVVTHNEPTVIRIENTSTEIAAAASFPETGIINDGDSYLGPPRNADTTPLSADPMLYPIEWELNDDTPVGAVFSELAKYIGYELVVADAAILTTYNRLLPAAQKRVTGINIADGFEIVSGRGLVTVFDHLNRTVTHTPK